jgi:hypothetical protein
MQRLQNQMSLCISARKFRCFDAIDRIELAPLTILVGENSTGKSSFLAMLRYLIESAFGGGSASFNKEPFFLGSFEQIAFNPGGQAGRSETTFFELIKRINPKTATERLSNVFDPHFKVPTEIKYEINLRNIASQAQLSAAKIELGSSSIEADFITSRAKIRSGRNEFESALAKQSEDLAGSDFQRSLQSLPFNIYTSFAPQKEKNAKFEAVRNGLFEAINFLGYVTHAERHSVYASAPVRTEPRRTYNPVDQTPTPDGRHVLNMLASLKRRRSSRWRRLKLEMDRFGSLSGLFRSFDIRLLGTRESDPFQAQVKIGGIPSNIIDVGYGVSQVIPIVYAITQSDNNIVLLQQPEVHLHPRAQAGLGSLLLSASKEKTIVVETHSDYIIDQVRIDLRDSTGKLDPQNVAIYYFERDKSRVRVARINLDEFGNIIRPPIGYRKFFIDHDNGLLGLDDVANS